MPPHERVARPDDPSPPLLLVRHAQDCHDDGGDPGLTPRGRAQARALAERVAEHRDRYRVVYCSPLRRARETAAILAASLDLPAIVDPRLASVPDGVRALPALWGLERAAPELGARGGAIVVTHAGPFRFLLVRLEGARRLAWLWRRIPHCCAVACHPAPRRLDMGGPLAMYALGLAAGLLASPGPRPSPGTWLSHLAALGAHEAARRLTRRGDAPHLVALVAGGALASTVAAFGPSHRANRKVTALNAWAFRAGARLPRLTPVAPHPNGVAGGLAVSLGLLGGMARHAMAPTTRAVAAAAAVASLAALVLTACRSGWAAGVSAMLVLEARRGPRQAAAALAASGAAIAAGLLMAGTPAPGQPSLRSTESMRMRLDRWRATTTLVSRTPLTGLGLGRLPAVCRGALGDGAFKTPNSTPLQVWADAGLLGLASLAWGLARAGRVLRRARTSPDIAPPWFVDGLASGLAALLVHGAMEVSHAIVWSRRQGLGYLASPLPYLVLGALSGLADRLDRAPSSAPPAGPATPSPDSPAPCEPFCAPFGRVVESK
jgi:broad specificity phosphatase PhoE